MFKLLKTGLLAFLLVSATGYAQAQKKINEGTATYTVAYSLTPDMAAMEAMLPKESKIKFKEGLMKTQMEQGPALITVMVDKGTETGLLLLDIPIMQLQYAVKMTKVELDETKKDAPVFSDFVATGEKKTIASYAAEKYTHKDDKGNTYELWVTQDLQLPTAMKETEFSTVKGTPLVYTSFRNGIKSVLTLKSIKEEAVGDISLNVPKGYQLKTMEDLKALQGGR